MVFIVHGERRIWGVVIAAKKDRGGFKIQRRTIFQFCRVPQRCGKVRYGIVQYNESIHHTTPWTGLKHLPTIFCARTRALFPSGAPIHSQTSQHAHRESESERESERETTQKGQPSIQFSFSAKRNNDENIAP